MTDWRLSLLPIDACLPALRQALEEAPAAVLEAPPGAGKTTRVPLALLTAPWLAGQKILMLEPRRLAARSACLRMSSELGESPGQTVGYRVRFDQQVGPTTRVEVLTEGILTRRLQQDPELAGVGLVIFDEFHERSLQADLGLALCREVQQALRPALRLLLMSATLDGAAAAALLDDAPRIQSQGRLHPVEIRHCPAAGSEPLAHLTEQVFQAMATAPGDVLVFLPGGGEIRRAAALCAARAEAGLRIVPLYGDLPLSEQQAAILPDPEGRRRVVLATPIAETSLTIEGVGVVVDSGLARVPRFQPRLGMTRLVTERISQDAAEQRAGRAGRLGPGRCLRLWPETERLAPRRTPELLSADLAPLALELAQWGADAGQLAWLDPPPPAALQQARDLLQDLGALDRDGRITPRGRAMAALPGHPRLAHMLLRARQLGLAALGCELAALLEERDPLRAEPGAGADLSARLALLAGQRHGSDRSVLKRLRQASAQWRQALARQTSDTHARPWRGDRTAAPGLLLALAYPDRIAQRRPRDRHRYLLANGRGARLAEDDPLAGSDWLVAAHVEAGEQESRIFLAARVAREDLERELDYRITNVAQVRWDPQAQAVSARQERRLGSLCLDGVELTDPDPQALRAALCEGLRQLGLESLPWTPRLRQWQARVESLRQWCPALEFPRLDDGWLTDNLETWLGPFLDGIGRRSHLSRVALAPALQALLPWPLPARLDSLTPGHWVVPSGSRVALRYHPDASPPVLAVRLQELFGLIETPQVAEGRMPVLLELLSPAHRPIQRTRDLESFWANTYPEVRRELKGRYPKHYWPEDPFQATAIRGVRPRQ